LPKRTKEEIGISARDGSLATEFGKIRESGKRIVFWTTLSLRHAIGGDDLHRLPVDHDVDGLSLRDACGEQGIEFSEARVSLSEGEHSWDLIKAELRIRAKRPSLVGYDTLVSHHGAWMGGEILKHEIRIVRQARTCVGRDLSRIASHASRERRRCVPRAIHKFRMFVLLELRPC
jgi:hypothetical protein